MFLSLPVFFLSLHPEVFCVATVFAASGGTSQSGSERQGRRRHQSIAHQRRHSRRRHYDRPLARDRAGDEEEERRRGRGDEEGERGGCAGLPQLTSAGDEQTQPDAPAQGHERTAHWFAGGEEGRTERSAETRETAGKSAVSVRGFEEQQFSVSVVASYRWWLTSLSVSGRFFLRYC